MTEIKKLTKILIIPLAVIPFIFGIMDFFFYDAIYLPITGWTNPMLPKFIGGLFILGSIFAVIILRKQEWEEIRLVYLYLYLQFLPAFLSVLIVWILFGSTFSPALISEFVFELIIMAIMLLLGVFGYIKQVK